MSDVLKDFIQETVIDATERFKQRRSDALQSRLKSVADDIPGALRRQAQQERALNDRFQSAKDTFSISAGQRMARVAAPLAFTGDGYEDDLSFFEAITFASRGARGYDQLKAFVTANIRQIDRALQALKDEMKSIATEADTMEWSADWRRYSKWGSFQQDVANLEDKLNRLRREQTFRA